LKSISTDLTLSLILKKKNYSLVKTSNRLSQFDFNYFSRTKGPKVTIYKYRSLIVLCCCVTFSLKKTVQSLKRVMRTKTFSYKTFMIQICISALLLKGFDIFIHFSWKNLLKFKDWNQKLTGFPIKFFLSSKPKKSNRIFFNTIFSQIKLHFYSLSIQLISVSKMLINV
jgi:hypothetical protein